MAMRPIVARVETTTEFAGIILAEDSRRPFSEIVRFVVVISEMKSVGGVGVVEPGGVKGGAALIRDAGGRLAPLKI